MASVISDAEYEAWLYSIGESRVLLLEMDHSDGTVYFGNLPFISKPSDSKSNIIFDDVLKDSINFESRVDEFLEIGDLEIINDSSLNYLIDYKWKGFEIRFYLGDPLWGFDDFRNIANGIGGGISTIKRGILIFDILDNTIFFDKFLQKNLLPSELPKPIAFGEPFNVKPALVDSSAIEYQINDGPVTSFTTRDNGAALTPDTSDLDKGLYTLSTMPVGAVSADIIEPNDTPKEIINYIADKFGKTANQTSLDALPTYKLGLFYDSFDVTGKTVLDDVAKSIYGFWKINLLDELTFGLLKEPEVVADFEITENDIAEGGIKSIEIDDPAQKVILNYKKNFNVLDRNSLAGIVAANPDLAEDFIKEWRQVEKENFEINLWASAPTLGTGWADNSDDSYTCDGTQVANSDLEITGKTTLNESYYTAIAVYNRSAGNVRVVVGDDTGAGSWINSDGIYYQTIPENTSDGRIRVQADSDFVGSVHLISFKEVSDYPESTIFIADSFISNSTDAQTECDRIALLKSVVRKTWEVECFLAPAQAEPGQTVKINHPRFGFENGKNALILSVSRSYTEQKVILEVWL